MGYWLDIFLWTVRRRGRAWQGSARRGMAGVARHRLRHTVEAIECREQQEVRGLQTAEGSSRLPA